MTLASLWSINNKHSQYYFGALVQYYSLNSCYCTKFSLTTDLHFRHYSALRKKLDVAYFFFFFRDNNFIPSVFFHFKREGGGSFLRLLHSSLAVSFPVQGCFVGVHTQCTLYELLLNRDMGK